jgi:exonuclease SbcC
MRIKSIRLHPFAGQVDRTFEFTDALNLVHGENEFGKSTLFHAISAALFITPRPHKSSEDYRAILRSLPRKGGGEVRVTLIFESEGKSNELHKTWSTTQNLCSITLKDGAAQYIGDQAEVRLNQLLCLNRASWEHMLFIEQSSIHETIVQLRSKLGSLDTIQSFTKGADPFDREGFIQAVQKQLKDLESRWDATLQRPENGRGIENPWAQSVGLILKAWYEKEQFRSRHHQMLHAETRIGALNRAISEISVEKERIDAFIKNGEPLLKDANRSLEIVSEKEKVGALGNQLKEIHKDWLTAEATLPAMREELSRLTDEVATLQQESANANKRAAANDMMRRDADVKKLVVHRKNQQQTLAEMTEIPEDIINEVNACEKSVQDARLRLEAQRLKATLESDVELKVSATVDGKAAQEILVRPGISETMSSLGSFSLSYGSLHLRVVSGNIDVDELERSISRHEETINERCADCGVAGIDGLRTKRADLLKLREDMKGTERDLKTQLGGKDLASWNQEVEALAQIPATRDSSVILADLNVRIPRVAKLGVEIKGLVDKTSHWQKDHGSPEELMDKVVDLRTQWKKLVEDAAALKPLPEEYKHPTQFIDALQQHQRERDALQGELTSLKEERGNLQGGLDKEEFSAVELFDKMQSAESRHKHLLAQAQSLRRILTVHESLQQKNQENPFDKVGARIVELLGRLSGGRYSMVDFHQNLPEKISNHDISLETDLLSKGMKGSLALAVRLAYAEVYLADMDGFLMLDDPFTELDPDRRAFAAGVLKEMAGDKQVILYTCHPEHAKLMKDMSAEPVQNR